MKTTDSAFALAPIVVLFVIMLSASSCEQQMTASDAGKVDEIPLLVQFDERNCPVAVLQVIESCDARHQAPDQVCREQGQKISWFAVKGESLPYQRGDRPPAFGIVFKDKNDDPIENSRGGHCKDSSNGVLDCKIKKNAKREKSYGYSVVAGECSLDPRVYVP